jgi:hypothetical protein
VHERTAVKKVFVSSLYDGTPPFRNGLAVLTQSFEARGFTIVSSLEEATHVVLVDFQPEILEKAKNFGITRKNLSLILREPKVVHPGAYEPEFVESFGKVIKMGGVENGIMEFPWAYEIPNDWERAFVNEIRSSEAVAIASWRISMIEGNNYELRSASYRLESVRLFGRGWNDPLSKKIRETAYQLYVGLRSRSKLRLRHLTKIHNFTCRNQGSVESKIETLSMFRVGLVIENCNDYFSEKLLDSLFAGTIPVYVGPPIASGFSSRTIAIQAAPNLQSIRDGLRAAAKIDYSSWKKEVLELIKSDIMKRWSHESVWNMVAAGLIDEFEGKSCCE